MSYLCDICGTVFDAPAVRVYRERIDGWTRRDTERVCPVCGNEYYTPADECVCGAPIHQGDRLCLRCRSGLLARVQAFSDDLTAREAEQFDDWMDGSGIRDWRDWK